MKEPLLSFRNCRIVGDKKKKSQNITSLQSETTFRRFETFRGGGEGRRKGGVRFLPLSSWKTEISAKRCGDFHPCSCIIPSRWSLRPSRFRRPNSNMSSNTCCWRRPAPAHTFTVDECLCGSRAAVAGEEWKWQRAPTHLRLREKKLSFVFCRVFFLRQPSVETSHSPRLF